MEEKIEKYEKALELIGTNYKRGNSYCPKPFVANTDYLINHNDTEAYNTAVTNNQSLLSKYVEKTKKYDASYQAPSQPGGCYVATAVYGSYDCPQVWTLRRYRDYTLAETWHGRAFIHTYYAISPTLVKWFGNTKWFKKMWKGKLDRMVENLKANGVEDTPYQDRNW